MDYAIIENCEKIHEIVAQEKAEPYFNGNEIAGNMYILIRKIIPVVMCTKTLSETILKKLIAELLNLYNKVDYTMNNIMQTMVVLLIRELLLRLKHESEFSRKKHLINFDNFCSADNGGKDCFEMLFKVGPMLLFGDKDNLGEYMDKNPDVKKFYDNHEQDLSKFDKSIQ